MIDGIDHIYVICCGKFEDRKNYMENAMKSLGFASDYYTLTLSDPALNFSENSYWESLDRKTVDEYYDVDVESRRKELIVTDQLKYAPANISLADISVSISHLLVWKDAVAKKYDRILILEDDILFLKHSMKQLKDIMKVLPENFDLISLEDGAMMHADMYGHKIVPDQLLYKIESGRMRCTGSYLISRKACENIVKWHKQKKWTLEIDHVIDLYGKLGLLEIWWAEPCVFTQGSQRGVYGSGVQTKHIKKMTVHDLRTGD